MRRLQVPAAFFAAVLLAPMVPAPAAEPADTEVVVVLEPGTEAGAAAADLAAAHGGSVGFVYQSALEGFTLQVPASQWEALAADPRVAFVEADAVVTLPQAEEEVLEPAVSQVLPTGVDRVEGDRNPTDGSVEDVDIAIIDSGIHHRSDGDGSLIPHPDLNLVAATDCTAAFSYPAGGGCEDDGDIEDGHGHGTHVAGIAAAVDNDLGALGAAPGARLWSVKVVRPNGSSSLGMVLAGVDYVTEHADEIEVANLSLGAPGVFRALDQAITRSVSRGVVYTVAAGNSGADASGFSPASHPYVITVSAMADFDGREGGLADPTCLDDGVADDELAEWSNYGEAVALAAPGVCILSTWIGDRYAVTSGTSMAAPLVAGAAARLIAERGRAHDLSGVMRIKEALIESGWEQDSSCGFSGDGDDSHEPLISLNSDLLGGDGECGSEEESPDPRT